MAVVLDEGARNASFGDVAHQYLAAMEIALVASHDAAVAFLQAEVTMLRNENATLRAENNMLCASVATRHASSEFRVERLSSLSLASPHLERSVQTEETEGPEVRSGSIDQHGGVGMCVEFDMLTSGVVELQADTETAQDKRSFWVHASLLDAIPHFHAGLEWRKRLTMGSMAPAPHLPVMLPAHCGTEGLGLLLTRLYWKGTWPLAEWMRRGWQSLLHAGVLADMWGLEPVVAEAASALHAAALDPKGRNACVVGMQNMVLPPALQGFGRQSTIGRMTLQEVQDMVISVATASAASSENEEGAELTLRLWTARGQSDSVVLLAPLQRGALFSREEECRRVSNSGKTSYWSATWELVSPPGFGWLCDKLEEKVRCEPSFARAAVNAILQEEVRTTETASIEDNFFMRKQTDNTLAESSRHLIQLRLHQLLHLAADQAQAGYLETEVYDELVLRYTPDRVSADLLPALSDHGQCKIVAAVVPCPKRPRRMNVDWFTEARLSALRAPARLQAVRALAPKLGQLLPSVAAFVTQALRTASLLSDDVASSSDGDFSEEAMESETAAVDEEE